MKDILKMVLVSVVVSVLLITFYEIKIDNIKNEESEVERVEKITYRSNIETNYEELYENVVDGVVFISTYNGTGSGFVYKIEGDYAYVLTNEHVVANSREITVTTNNDNVIEDIEYLGGDSYYDIAVLKVKKTDDIIELKIGEIDDYDVGEGVMAIGSPLGEAYINTATLGILSGKERFVFVDESSYWGLKLIQTDAAINPGNSGGPLFGLDGKVIGINSLKHSSDDVEGMGFAIPMSGVLLKLDLLEEGREIRPSIGVSLREEQEGVRINSVLPGSAADKAGLKSGDMFVEIDGKKVTNLLDIRKAMYDLVPDQEIKVKINRNGKDIEETVVLDAYED